MINTTSNPTKYILLMINFTPNERRKFIQNKKSNMNISYERMMIMLFLMTLLALPVLIKICTNVGLLKLKLLPKSVITAEMVVEQMNRNKIRPLKVELLYNDVYYSFNHKLKNKEIDRKRIVAIRKYLNQSVDQYPHKKFDNDCHAIYTMLKAKDISRRNLEIVQKIIA